MPRISDLKEDDLQKHVKGLLFKVHVITGWNLPDDEYYLNVLKDQLRKKLLEEYSNCNISEIEFAFRNYGTTVKDWGKNMNLNLFDTVMDSYLTARKCITEFEERMKEEVEKPKPTDEEVMNMRRELVEGRYQSFLEGKSSFVLFPADGIDTLIKDGYCQHDLYVDFIMKAQQYLFNSYDKKIEDATKGLNKNKVNDLKELREQLIEDDNVEVKILAKKMALLFCFYKFKEAGYKNIYVQEIEV